MTSTEGQGVVSTEGAEAASAGTRAPSSRASRLPWVATGLVGVLGALVGAWVSPDGAEFISEAAAKVTPGCVLPDLVAGKSGIAVSTTVRADEDQCWSEVLTEVREGDQIEVNIRFRNLGESEVDDVVVRGSLPAGLAIVPYSTRWYEDDPGEGEDPRSDDVVDKGLELGSYATDDEVSVRFMVQVGDLSTGPMSCAPGVGLVGGVVTASRGASPLTASALVSPRSCDLGEDREP